MGFVARINRTDDHAAHVRSRSDELRHGLHQDFLTLANQLDPTDAADDECVTQIPTRPKFAGIFRGRHGELVQGNAVVQHDDFAPLAKLLSHGLGNGDDDDAISHESHKG